MGLFNRKKQQKDDKSDELTIEELTKVTAGVPKRNNDWCPKVDVSGAKKTVQDEEFLTEEELAQIKAGIHNPNLELEEEEIER